MDKTLILSEIKKYKKFNSDAEFARFLEIPAQNLSKWKARNTYDIELIYTKCPEINPEWLLTGQGEMLKNGDTINQNTTGNNNIQIGKGSIKGNNNINSNSEFIIKHLQKELEDYKNLLEDYKKMISEKDAQINKFLNILAK